MLQPAEISANLRGASEMASQSTRAWLAEQDLGGFDELDPAAVAAAAAAAPPADADNFGMPEDGYNYGQHLRQMGGGTFIERQRAAGGGSAAGGSVAGVSVTRSAVSGMSRMTRASRASIKSSLQLRDVAERRSSARPRTRSSPSASAARSTPRTRRRRMTRRARSSTTTSGRRCTTTTTAAATRPRCSTTIS